MSDAPIAILFVLFEDTKTIIFTYMSDAPITILFALLEDTKTIIVDL